jgi:hypothetical protein
MYNLIDKSSISLLIQDNLILVVILVFAVVYIIINYNKVVSGDMKNVDIKNTIFISIIVTLILYLLTLDNEINKEDIKIEKFNFNNFQKIENNNSKSLDVNNELDVIKGGSKYKIANNTLSNINDFDNQNIFISQKHIGRYGIKF